MAWIVAAAAALSTPATHTSASACTIDPALPANISQHASVQPLCTGYLDPTQLPYSAKGDGVTDDSAALQTVLDDAYINRMAVLLPAGRVYILGRQLRAVQRFDYAPDREHGYQLVGARGAAPPVLRVMDGASLANFPPTYASSSSVNRVARPALLYVRQMRLIGGLYKTILTLVLPYQQRYPQWALGIGCAPAPLRCSTASDCRLVQYWLVLNRRKKLK